MPIILAPDREETRATTPRVMAAVEEFLGEMLFGLRQHDVDHRWSLGPVPRFISGETIREGVSR